MNNSINITLILQRTPDVSSKESSFLIQTYIFSFINNGIFLIRYFYALLRIFLENERDSARKLLFTYDYEHELKVLIETESADFRKRESKLKCLLKGFETILCYSFQLKR